MPSENSDSIVNTNTCFCDSSQSIFDDKFNTSLLSNKVECDRCKNIIYQRENRRCSMCRDCVEELYSPKICENCHGRISFNDLMNTSIKHDPNIEKRNDYKMIKLCNCFPHDFHHNEIQNLCENSFQEVNFRQETFEEESKQFFNSQICFPLKRCNINSTESYASDIKFT